MGDNNKSRITLHPSYVSQVKSVVMDTIADLEIGDGGPTGGGGCADLAHTSACQWGSLQTDRSGDSTISTAPGPIESTSSRPAAAPRDASARFGADSDKLFHPHRLGGDGRRVYVVLGGGRGGLRASFACRSLR